MRTLDPNHLVRNLDGDRDLLERMVALFLESTAPIVDSIRANVADGDADALVRNAHQLRGALVNVGAQAGAQVATDLERLARGRELADARRALSSLESEMEKLRPALEELVSRSP